VFIFIQKIRFIRSIRATPDYANHFGDAMRRMLFCLGPLTTAGLVLCLGGCNGGYKRLPETGATLEGTVTYGKEKVAVALVIAQNESGSAQAFIGEGGRYKLENVPLGEVHIAVNTAAGKAQQRGLMMARSRGQEKGPLPKAIDVPDKYANPATSGITTTITEGANTFDIKIPR
jgi:hypothetical protein